MSGYYNHSSQHYDDLRLPPIRNSDLNRPSTRYVTPMEPPTHTSSSYPRNPPVTLPPLRNPDNPHHPPRSSSSMGYSSPHTHAPASASRYAHPHPPPPHPPHPPQPPPSLHRPAQHPYPQHHTPQSSSRHRHSFSSVSFSTPAPAPSVYHHSHSHHQPPPQAPPPHHHLSTSPTGSTSRAYMCDICGAAFSRAYDCKRHREIHTRQGGHECPHCHKALSRADALKRHMERGCAGMGVSSDDDEYMERHHTHDRRDRHLPEQPSSSRRLPEQPSSSRHLPEQPSSSRHYYSTNVRSHR